MVLGSDILGPQAKPNRKLDMNRCEFALRLGSIAVPMTFFGRSSFES